MSKLNRYKKPPVVKLPKILSTKPIVDVYSDDDDDDFQAPKPLLAALKQKESSGKTSSKTKSESVLKPNNDENPESSTSSQCKYFTTDQIENHLIAGNTRELSQKKISNGSKTKQTSVLDYVVELKNEPDNDPDNLDDEPNSNKVVCPFCWKKLNDKLTGTTHVKACAKNLPTNQIFEALQLQEKQIKEWEKLGIAYPGFVGPSVVAGKGRGGGTTRAPRTRKKKQNDPELELAIALSESLHEEVQRRNEDESNFLIKNGLQPETKGVKELKITQAAVKVQISSKSDILQLNNRSRKRGKKGNLKDLPLYTATEAEKKRSVEERLSRILDENEKKEKNNYFVREEIPVSSIGSSIRLDKFVDKESTLWKISSSGSTDTTALVNQAILDCKERNPESILKASTPLIKEDHPFDNDKKHVHPVKGKKVGPNSLDNGQKRHVDVMNDAGNSSHQFENKTKPIHPSNDASSSYLNKNQSSRFSNNSSTLIKLTQDFLSMLINKEDTDLTVYGRDEKPIKCHKIIVKARCPKLLDELVIETLSSGKKRPVISLTCYSHVAVKSFIKFIYCGQLSSSRVTGQDLQDIEEMSCKYGLDVTPVDNTLKQEINSACSYTKIIVDFKTQTNERIDDTFGKESCFENEEMSCKYGLDVTPVDNTLNQEINSACSSTKIIVDFKTQTNERIEDTFGNESCFENFPSILLEQPYDSPRPISNVPTSPILSQRNLQSNNLSSIEENDSYESLDNPSQRKSRKRKSISQPHGRISACSTNQPTKSFSPMQSGPNPHLGNRTPLLNYSTIDTPILKKELKRYGLKPLPRSKAKKILRHIYNETHK